jgi:hypothetical protein
VDADGVWPLDTLPEGESWYDGIQTFYLMSRPPGPDGSFTVTDDRIVTDNDSSGWASETFLLDDRGVLYRSVFRLGDQLLLDAPARRAAHRGSPG